MVRATAFAIALWGFLFSPALLPAEAATPEKVTITGEVMDTWCYLSGVMGGPEAVVGTSHHTCAVWCAAGGIPVGILAEDGTIYMVLKLEGSGTGDGNENILSIQSHQVTAEGLLYERDGLNYIVVEKVVADDGIVNETHSDFGVVPPFTIPGSVTEKVLNQ